MSRRVLVGSAIRKYGNPKRRYRAYARRNHRLETIGQRSYYDYLDSPEWKAIRKRVLDRDQHKCRICLGNATVVHHSTYSEAALRGRSIVGLFSICHACHKFIEFLPNGTKAGLAEVRQRTHLLLRLKGRAGVRLFTENQEFEARERRENRVPKLKPFPTITCNVCGNLKRPGQMYSGSATCVRCGNKRKRQGINPIAGNGAPVT